MTAECGQPEAPVPSGAVALAALRALRRGGVLAGLQSLHEGLGDIFQLPLPGFRSVVLVGPAAARFVLTASQEDLLWRAEQDPVTRLLRHGLLVTDGGEHDALRHIMTPTLHKRLFENYAQTITKNVDRVTEHWEYGQRIHLLDEMRRIALLSLMGALYNENFAPHVRNLWAAIEHAIRYISPGPWLIWPAIPRLGYREAIQRLDTYLYELIARRRMEPNGSNDFVSLLIAAGLSDELIRDQLLTMFIAGHDTSTALLAWSLALLTRHPEALAVAVAEVDAVIGPEMPSYGHVRQMNYLDCVIKEALRLYPPIHLGSRVAATDLSFGGFRIPSGTRVLYSIYLTHRHGHYWPNPDRFEPDRFSSEHAGERPAYVFVPFGGGPRNCIGAAFAQLEAKLVLARLLQHFEFRSTPGTVRARMHATLEPHPSIRVAVFRRPLGGSADV